MDAVVDLTGGVGERLGGKGALEAGGECGKLARGGDLARMGRFHELPGVQEAAVVGRLAIRRAA
jgi:hypothetical protein